MPTNINFDKKLGITGVTGISLPSSSTPSYQNEYSFQFGGIDEYVTLGAMTGSSLAITGDISISMWLKFSNSGGTEYAMNMGDSYGIYTSGGTIRGFSRVSGTFTALSSVGTFNDNVWHNVLYVKNSTNMLLYIDGVLNASNTNGGTSTITGLDMRLGARYTTANFYEGLMDEIAIWNSDQSANVSTIYNSGIPNNLNDLSTPPLSWWRMGEAATFDGIRDWDLVDQGTGGNNAVSQNIADSERVTDVPPNPFANTKSIELDGIDDLVSMGDVLNMANDGTDAFSYSLWYKTTDTGSFQMFIGKQRAAVWFNGVTFSMRGDLKNFNVFLGTGQGNQRIKGKTSTISDIRDGNWHHVCLTYDGSQVLSGMTLYYDNNPVTLSVDGTQGTPTNVSTLGQADFIIGARGLATSPNLPFNGNLDEVSYFTSELTASDVTSIYGTGVPNDISSLNPVGFWRCGDGDAAPTLTDNGSGGNDGTMTNFTTFSTDVPT